MPSDTLTAGATDVHTVIARSCARYAERPALVDRGGRGRIRTYAELGQQTAALAARLRGAGLIDSNGIGLLSENRPEWAVAYLGILAAGGTVVPLDANLKPDEIGRLVKLAGLRSIVCSGAFEEALRRLQSPLRVLSLESTSEPGWESTLPPGSGSEPGPPNEVAALIYTSGTTGAPKAVELTHRNLVANLDGIGQALRFLPEDVFLSILPLHHTFEATAGFLGPLAAGSTIVYARALNSRDIVEDIKHCGATYMLGVPLVFEKMFHTFHKKLADAPLPRRILFRTLYVLSRLGWPFGARWGRTFFRGVRQRAGLGSINYFVSGGAALPERFNRFFNLIGFTLLQGYGLTETSPVVSVNRPDDIRFGSIGPPLDNVEVRIDRPGPDGVGEILVRGGSVTRGYRGNADATAGLLRDGWLHTGDMGRLRHGHLWVTGRMKDIIVSAAGKNIYPEELEEKLLESNLVLEALVFGRNKENRHGEEVRALIVPETGEIARALDTAPDALDPERIRGVLADVVASVNGQVAAYKRIAGFDVQLEELEKTSTKKIKRFLYK